MEKLREILGHSSVLVTERYAHLRPDMFNDDDYSAVSVNLSEGKVIVLSEKMNRPNGSPIGHLAGSGAGNGNKKIN